MNNQDEIKKIQDELLQLEHSLLKAMSNYSQSNPAAVLNIRYLKRHINLLREELDNKLVSIVQASSAAVCSTSYPPSPSGANSENSA
jgi:capsule polysaccharide export protein KpsE/RkpR